MLSKKLTLPKIVAVVFSAAICTGTVAAAEHSATITLKIQSAASTDLEKEQLWHLVTRIRNLRGSRLIPHILPSGAVVKTSQVPDAVYKGIINAAFYIDRHPWIRDTLRLLSGLVCGLTLTRKTEIIRSPVLPGGEIMLDQKFSFRQRPSEQTPIHFLVRKDLWNRFTSEERKSIEQACRENVDSALKKIGR